MLKIRVNCLTTELWLIDFLDGVLLAVVGWLLFLDSFKTGQQKATLRTLQQMAVTSLELTGLRRADHHHTPWGGCSRRDPAPCQVAAGAHAVLRSRPQLFPRAQPAPCHSVPITCSFRVVHWGFGSQSKRLQQAFTRSPSRSARAPPVGSEARPRARPRPVAALLTWEAGSTTCLYFFVSRKYLSALGSALSIACLSPDAAHLSPVFGGSLLISRPALGHRTGPCYASNSSASHLPANSRQRPCMPLRMRTVMGFVPAHAHCSQPRRTLQPASTPAASQFPEAFVCECVFFLLLGQFAEWVLRKTSACAKAAFVGEEAAPTWGLRTVKALFHRKLLQVPYAFVVAVLTFFLPDLMAEASLSEFTINIPLTAEASVFWN